MVDGAPSPSEGVKRPAPWSRQSFSDFETATASLHQWETRYNYERLSLALKGQTPAEKLAAVRPPTAA
jgi:transposase InsO family protein